MSDIQLTSRDEELLKAILGEGIAEFEPQSRIEALLKRILDEGGMGGGGTRILGYYATLEDLEAAHPTGHINDAYLVGNPSHIYVWLPDVSEWHDSGQFEAIPGEPGVGIASIEKTATVGLVDTYTITYDDLRTTTFEITNGQNGTDGRDGTDGNGIVSIAKTSTAGLVDTYTVTFDDGDTTTFEVTNGAAGAPGRDGTDGNGIASIAKTATVGLVDTYTITFTDGQTTTFNVTNGRNGTDGTNGRDGIDGSDGNGIASIVKTATVGLVDTYTITFTNGQTTTFNVTNGQNGSDGTDGRDGIDGTDGISVVSVTINASDHLIVTLSNGNTQDAGRIPASNGYPLP